MNEENRKIIWKLIINKAEKIANKLPEHPNHPKGRNTYAHVCSKIIHEFGISYKLIKESRLEELKVFISKIKS